MAQNDVEGQPATGGQDSTKKWPALKYFGIHSPNTERGSPRQESLPLEGRHHATTGDLNVNHEHIEALKVLFGLGPDFATSWPGSLHFCRHIEKLMATLIDNEYDAVWSLLGSPQPKTSLDCWKWCLAVAGSIQKLPTQRQTIEGICNQLARDREIPVNHRGALDMTEAQLMEIHRAIFAVLCWFSASLKPVLKRERSTTSATQPISLGLPVAWVENSDYAVPSTDLKRPATKMFRGFRNHVNDVEHVPQDAIIESVVTFASLHRIGNVNLKLVDCLTDHLQFNTRRRTLSIFRFPSFCVMNILRKDTFPIIDNIIPEILPAAAELDSADMHREVLLSYRVLFAQTSASRRLMKNYLNKFGREEGEVDPFLTILCTKKLSYLRGSCGVPKELFPFPTNDMNGFLVESDTYSPRGDFSVFSQRLQALQRYNNRQQPSKVKDLWRDRRNPLQWYTFWAVLWVGGISIILSVLQLGVGIAQLYYAVP